ncbi:MAG TPA: hypothetical protein VNL71_05475 [Chloroflexota bacterium]|nr:hypothetical protein [Chloroflexota bacterium]
MADDSGLLPAFTKDGVLPPGDYPLTLEDLAVSSLVGGPASHLGWDAAWRAELVTNLGILAHQLWHVGIDAIYVDGSFVEEKAHPHDIDGYFECDVRYLASGALERDLNVLDPHKAWTWHPQNRRWDPDSGKAQLPMWFAYHVELYPHFGQPAGITDQFGNQLQFPSAFRLSRRSYAPKGIVRIVRS